MAVKVRMRLWEGKELDAFINSTKNIPMHVIASKAKVLEILMNGLSTIAEGEIDPLTNKLQGTTAVALEQLSSSNVDNSSGTGAVELVETIGVDENNEPFTHEEYQHAATGTTVITTTQTFMDVWHTHAVEWGSADLDAEGTVDVRKIDDTILSRILATANEGAGSGFKIPTGWLCSLLGGRLECVGAIGAGQGTIFTMRVLDAIDLVTDVRVLTDHIWQVDDSHRSQELQPSIKIFQSGTEITFHQIYLVAAEDFSVRMYFLLWKK